MKIKKGFGGWLITLTFMALLTTSCMKREKYYEVNTDFLNVRTTHGMVGEVIGILEKGDVVEVLWNEGMWSQIYFIDEDQYAWVYSDYLTEIN